MNIQSYNQRAWDKAVERGSRWTQPVSRAVIEAARQGDWSLVLTPHKPVPQTWYPTQGGHTFDDCDVLCLASGGGQQGPVLAAAGARVTVFDNSAQQLTQDRLVAQRDGLTLHTVQGDMADLSYFADGTFDLIFHPCSNLFVPDVLPVWQEAYRVLRNGGTLLAGFCNPVSYIFDQQLADKGILEVKYRLPYSDLTSLTADQRQFYIDDLQPMEFGHTLKDQIGGQIDAGFAIIGFYEDSWPGTALAKYMPTYIATRAKKK